MDKQPCTHANGQREQRSWPKIHLKKALGAVPAQLFQLDASQHLMDVPPGPCGRLRHFHKCSSAAAYRPQASSDTVRGQMEDVTVKFEAQ